MHPLLPQAYASIEVKTAAPLQPITALLGSNPHLRSSQLHQHLLTEYFDRVPPPSSQSMPGDLFTSVMGLGSVAAVRGGSVTRVPPLPSLVTVKSRNSLQTGLPP